MADTTSTITARLAVESAKAASLVATSLRVDRSEGFWGHRMLLAFLASQTFFSSSRW